MPFFVKSTYFETYMLIVNKPVLLRNNAMSFSDTLLAELKREALIITAGVVLAGCCIAGAELGKRLSHKSQAKRLLVDLDAELRLIEPTLKDLSLCEKLIKQNHLRLKYNLLSVEFSDSLRAEYKAEVKRRIDRVFGDIYQTE